MSAFRKLQEQQTNTGSWVASAMKVFGWISLFIGILCAVIPFLFNFGPLGFFIAMPFLLLGGMLLFAGKLMGRQMKTFKAASSEAADIVEHQLKKAREDN